MKNVVFLLIILSILSASCTVCAATVGICQLIQHDALDAATRGFRDALSERMPDVQFNEQNASGDVGNCAMINNTFAAEDVDLILANATASLQAAVSATVDIPILGTSITDYATALGLSNFTGITGFNVSGTTDLAPLDGQAEVIHELFPDAKTVGLFYCSSEPNSIYQITTIRGYLEALGYTCRDFSYTDSNDLSSVAQNAADNCDVLYIPTDNTSASYAETIANVILPAGLPAVTGDEGTCSVCGIATLAISYYDIGYATGVMAYDILANGADITTMPIQSTHTVVKKVQTANCQQLGISIPEGYEPIQ